MGRGTQRGFRTCVLSHYGRDRDAGNAFQKNVRGTQIAGFTCAIPPFPPFPSPAGLARYVFLNSVTELPVPRGDVN